MTWKPCPRTEMDFRSLPLDSRQGYLLSRLDGCLPLDLFPEVSVERLRGKAWLKGVVEE